MMPRPRRHPRTLLSSIVWGALIALASPAVDAVGSPPDWRAKVDPWVLSALDGGGEVEFLVVLAEQAELEGAAARPAGVTRGRWVFERLTALAEQTQAPLRARLVAAGIEYRPFWVTNMIWVRGDLATAASLAERSDVARLFANPRVRLDAASGRAFAEASGRARVGAGVEPNIDATGAPEIFWSAGFRGEGIVVAGQDSGVEWDHPALRRQYRGWDGADADHNYQWHDAIHSGGGICGPDSPVPCDDNGHGTLTLAIAVADDGAGNQVGMAPRAQWIACRNMDEGVGTPASYSECFQFFIAPTDLNDENPDPDRAPQVINNSWVCPPSEGCTDPEVLKTVVENARAAGIAVVASAGNDGSGCSSIQFPAPIYDAAWTIGSVNIEGELSTFSSRGPVAVDGSNRLKPDLCAPGEAIRTAVPGGGYGEFSGTSVSGPHVAGWAALAMSAESCLKGDVDAMEVFVKRTALPWEAGENCGDIPGNESPNNSYGYGTLQSVLPVELDCSPSLTVQGSCPGSIVVDLSRLTPGGAVAIVGAERSGNTSIPAGPCAGSQLALDSPRFFRQLTADAAGGAVIEREIVAGQCGLLLQAIDLGDCTTSGVVAVP